MDHTPPAPPHAPHGGRRIVREPDDRRIAGVCSGLADHLGVDVTVVRVTAVVLALVTPAALIAYLVAAVALPERPADQPRVRARHVHLGQVPHPLVVVGAIVAVAVLIDDAWWLDPFPAAIALVGIGVWLVVSNRDGAESAGGDPSAGYAGPYGTGRPADPGTSTGIADPHTSGASDDEPRDAAPEGDATTATAVHPMASSPWLVSVSQHSGTVSDHDTTFVGEHAPDLSESPSREGTGPSGEIPPPASPWWSGHPAAPPAPQPVTEPHHRSPAGAIVMALLLIGAGTLWLLAGADVVSVDPDDVLALGLLVVGAGLLVTSWRGRGYALIPLGLVLAGTLVAGEVIEIPLGAGIGDRTVVVDSADELDSRHELFVGDLTIDLTQAPLPAGRTTEVEAAVGAGELHVIVPRDVAVDVTATTRGGEVTSPGGPEANETGFGVDTTFTIEPVPADDADRAPADQADPAAGTDDRGTADPAGGSERAGSDPPRLALDLSVGLGTVEVERG